VIGSGDSKGNEDSKDFADGTRLVIKTCMQNMYTISKPSPIKKGKTSLGMLVEV